MMCVVELSYISRVDESLELTPVSGGRAILSLPEASVKSMTTVQHLTLQLKLRQNFSSFPYPSGTSQTS